MQCSGLCHPDTVMMQGLRRASSGLTGSNSLRQLQRGGLVAVRGHRGAPFVPARMHIIWLQTRSFCCFCANSTTVNHVLAEHRCIGPFGHRLVDFQVPEPACTDTFVLSCTTGALTCQAAGVSNPSQRVVITGQGIASCFGNDVDTFYEKCAAQIVLHAGLCSQSLLMLLPELQLPQAAVGHQRRGTHRPL